MKRFELADFDTSDRESLSAAMEKEGLKRVTIGGIEKVEKAWKLRWFWINITMIFTYSVCVANEEQNAFGIQFLHAFCALAIMWRSRPAMPFAGPLS